MNMENLDLQKIYDEREAWVDDWFEKYKQRVTLFVELIKNESKWSEEDLYYLIQAQDNNIANNGQWGTIYNTDKNPEFDNIKEKWDTELLPIISDIVRNEDIRMDQYDKIKEIIFSCCSKKKKIAVNRIIAAFLPNKITTTVNEEDFFYVENNLKERLTDYKPTNNYNWIEGNKYFTKYCNEKVKFDDPWQCSIFNWILREYFKWEEQQIRMIVDEKNKKNEYMETYKTLLLNNHNLILTGAPGTGKTYLAKQIAQKMIFDEVKEKMNDEEQKQFNEQCGFVQFHPSYDYTDFVEGLRPTPPNKDGNVGFERKDGEFKVFCKKALLRSDSNETDIFNGINDNPKVWKVSLSGTGDNDIRKYCKENDCIRIDWKEYGNVEDFSEYDFKESEVAKDFRSRGLAVGEKILKSFQNEMEIGDIVVSCFSEKETDAIGIITGDYEYIEEWANDYPRCRKVRWIWKGTPNDIIGLNNNKKLTLSTIYKLDIDPITIKDYINKISGYSDSKKEERKFVFIIDEINRGEINKIFGELFFSIDPGYRGEKGRVQTQYQNMVEDGDAFKKGFFVPENVYIIGTMNDIDRSVESMDFAFRRRFAFKEVTAKETQTMLDSDDAWKDETGVSQKPENNVIDEIKARMNSLNAAIEEIEGLSSAYHIGASYFLKLANYKGKNDSYNYDELWIYHLEGLLREYLRGMPNAEDNIIKLHNAYNKGNSDNKSVDVTENESTANSGQSGE